MRNFLLFLIVLLSCTQIKASHIAALDLTYICLGDNQYEVTVKVYRSCELFSAEAPFSMPLAFYSTSCGFEIGEIFLERDENDPEDGIVVALLCEGDEWVTTCENAEDPDAFMGYESYVYRGILTLPAECPDWILYSYICCRNAGITNVVDPDLLGSVVEALLNNTPEVGCNSSPQFDYPPIQYLCPDFTRCIPQGAWDPDGDEMIFELTEPMGYDDALWVIEPPFTSIPYIAPYNYLQPFNGVTSIDPLNGDVCVTPNTLQTSVLAVQASEFRDGQLIGYVRRDAQLNVDYFGCQDPPPPPTGYLNNGVYTSSFDSTVCSGLPLDLEFYGLALNFVYINLISPPPQGSTVEITGNGTDSVYFAINWTPLLSDIGIHQFQIEVTDSSCPILNINTYTYQVEVIPSQVQFTPFSDICIDAPNLVLNQGSPAGGEYFGTGVSNGAFNPSSAGYGEHQIYYYYLDTLGCDDTIPQTIIVREPTATISGNEVLCYGAESVPLPVNFTGNPPWSLEYTYNGNNYTESNILNPNYNILSNIEATYELVEVWDDLNCPGSVYGTANIRTEDLPTATISGGGIICPYDSAFVEINFTGAPPYTFELDNGDYKTLHQNEYSPFSFYSNSEANYSTISLIDENGCIAIESGLNGNGFVAYRELYDPSIITFIDTIICPVDDPIQMKAITSGGTWLGSGMNIYGEFDPHIAGVGNHWISYNFNEHCNETDSVLMIVGCDLQLYIPNSFTPNGDGINETFVIKGKNILTFELGVYSRDGEKLYHTNDIAKPWKGDFKERIVQTGAYTYIIAAYGKDEQSVKKTGTVNVLR